MAIDIFAQGALYDGAKKVIKFTKKMLLARRTPFSVFGARLREAAKTLVMPGRPPVRLVGHRHYEREVAEIYKGGWYSVVSVLDSWRISNKYIEALKEPPQEKHTETDTEREHSKRDMELWNF